ncbi:MAG: hypothetical protein ACI9K5_000613 [Gammaproteobacteria bacterium]|jgi:hypothetical protein
MITTLATLTLIAAASPATPLAAAPLSSGGEVVQIRAATVLVGDGTTLTDALVLVEDGKIKSIGKGADANADLPLFEHDGVLSAGIVVAQTESGAAAEVYESARSTLPTARVTYAFDPDHSDFDRALESGVTTLVLAPSARNLVGGLTAVVKSHGGTVVAADAQLAISFAQSAIGGSGGSAFGVFFGDAEGTASAPMAIDGSPENTASSGRGERTPTSYPGSLDVLGNLFGSAAEDGPLARAKEGSLPVLLEAWDRNEVARALAFAKANGLTGALRGAPLAGDPRLLESIKASGLGVIVGPFQAGQRRRSLESVGQLQAAGVTVAFALAEAGTNPDLLRLSAAMAVQAGADLDKTWSALTGDAARMAGVAGRVGTVAVGCDADLVFWSGHPLDLTSSVESVWIDGALVHSAKASK